MALKDHLNKLEYFCLVAESGSFRKASELARIGQPRLTQVVQQLEDVLQASLLVRSAKGVALTKEGRILLERSRAILDQATQAELLLRAAGRPLKGTVHIGAYESIARYFLADFLKFLEVAAPEIRLHVRTGRSAQLQALTAAGELDLSIAVQMPGARPDCPQTILYHDQFALFASPSMREAFRNTLIYLPLPLNDPEASMRRFRFDQSIACEGLETVRVMAEQGVGVALLPSRVAKESVLAKRLIPFSHPRIRSPLFDRHEIVLCRNSRAPSPVLAYVAEEIERFLRLWSL